MSKASTLRKACQELAKVRNTFQHNPERFAELDKLVTELDKLSNPVKVVPKSVVRQIGLFERAVSAKAEYYSAASQPPNGYDISRNYARALNSLCNMILKHLN